MTSLDHLLPEADEAVRCADHTRRLSIDPGGTAIRADRVVLIDTPLPWPKPVFAHRLLSEIDPILKAAVVPTRTLATVPLDDVETGSDPSIQPLTTVVTLDRLDDGQMFERRFEPATPAQLVAIATAAASDDIAVLDDLAVAAGRSSEPMVLICTQGSHDVCCGSEGARLAAEVESARPSGRPVRVRRVSHTGGHRFAPTAMTLPDGRMWADLDADLVERIVARTGPVDDELISRCRGWWGADTGPAQMAERAVFAHHGWDLENTERSVDQGGLVDGAFEMLVTVGGGQRFSVEVGVARNVPSIACREPGGLPAKPSVEYQIKRLEPVRSE